MSIKYATAFLMVFLNIYNGILDILKYDLNIFNVFNIYGVLGWTILFKIKDYFLNDVTLTDVNIENNKNPYRYLISNIHAISSVLFSLKLLWNPCEKIEKHLITSMIGYFIADLYQKFKEKQYDMYLHHILCIICLYYVTDTLPWNNEYIPNFLAKTTLLEISTPYLNVYKTFKNPLAGIGLLVNFFLFRIVWLSYIYYDIIYKVPDEQINPSLKKALIIFVLLNYYWFFKMILIAYRKFFVITFSVDLDKHKQQ